MTQTVEGVADTFAFVIHPIDPKRDVGRKYPMLGKLPTWLIDYLSLFFPPVYISEIRGIQSEATGRSVRGWFVACPLTPKRLLNLPPSIAYKKIIQAGRLAERLGAKILGLGALTSVVGDGGITIADRLGMPVTTGNSYTVAIAAQAIRKAATRMDVPIGTSTVAVVGASGTIGAVCAELLSEHVGTMLLVSRNIERLISVEAKVRAAGCQHVELTQNIERLTDANLVITVTSATDAVIQPHHLRRGAIVCDVARPRDVSRMVIERRPDVLIIEGGMVEVPGEVDFGFDFGFPPRMAYACMAETMVLALDRQYVSYTLGKELELSQVRTIDKIASRHGFRLGGFRSFERAITETDIAEVRAQLPASQVAFDS